MFRNYPVLVAAFISVNTEKQSSRSTAVSFKHKSQHYLTFLHSKVW